MSEPKSRYIIKSKLTELDISVSEDKEFFKRFPYPFLNHDFDGVCVKTSRKDLKARMDAALDDIMTSEIKPKKK